MLPPAGGAGRAREGRSWARRQHLGLRKQLLAPPHALGAACHAPAPRLPAKPEGLWGEWGQRCDEGGQCEVLSESIPTPMHVPLDRACGSGSLPDAAAVPNRKDWEPGGTKPSTRFSPALTLSPQITLTEKACVSVIASRRALRLPALSPSPALEVSALGPAPWGLFRPPTCPGLHAAAAGDTAAHLVPCQLWGAQRPSSAVSPT